MTLDQDTVPTGTLPVFGQSRSALTAAGVARSRVEVVRRLLSASLLGSAVVHGAVIPEHVHEWPLAAEFFWLLVMAEAVVGVLVLRRDRSSTLTTVAWLSFATVLLWTYSRTRGLPFGPEPWEAEPVGVADLAATSLGLVSLALTVALLWRPGWIDGRADSRHLRGLGLASIVAVTAIGVCGSTLPVVGVLAPAVPAHGGEERHEGSPGWPSRLPGTP